jgi:hypothetical protein
MVKGRPLPSLSRATTSFDRRQMGIINIEAAMPTRRLFYSSITYSSRSAPVVFPVTPWLAMLDCFAVENELELAGCFPFIDLGPFV